MNILAWLLYFVAAVCITVGLIALSPPLAIVALGVVLGRVATMIDKEGTA